MDPVDSLTVLEVPSKYGSQHSVATSEKESSQHADSIAVTALQNVLQPTSGELETLRRVQGKIPIGAWLVAAIGFSERFTYYGFTATDGREHAKNYIQNARDDPLRPGALGHGETSATRLIYFLTFFVYATSFGGAIVADGWLGRYKSLTLFATFTHWESSFCLSHLSQCP
ncbi:hypothetical protein K438DRAFT_2149861 [Mycena galopus ATCC 62051]|nr:hypothetical protein K438DRAFT_2149861 [Mycena galopus ATCC 62051]